MALTRRTRQGPPFSPIYTGGDRQATFHSHTAPGPLARCPRRMHLPDSLSGPEHIHKVSTMPRGMEGRGCRRIRPLSHPPRPPNRVPALARAQGGLSCDLHAPSTPPVIPSPPGPSTATHEACITRHRPRTGTLPSAPASSRGTSAFARARGSDSLYHSIKSQSSGGWTSEEGLNRFRISPVETPLPSSQFTPVEAYTLCRTTLCKMLLFFPILGFPFPPFFFVVTPLPHSRRAPGDPARSSPFPPPHLRLRHASATGGPSCGHLPPAYHYHP